MSGTNRLEDKLSIVIVTYNRSKQLDKTLNYLRNSPIRNCNITILNNCSTDNTKEICEKHKIDFNNLNIITHPVNLGSGSANIVQSINYCHTEYLWILCDDDKYDFEYFDDVKDEILLGRAEIIQVGAHDDGLWEWGEYATPEELIARGYKYFKYSSFTPCTIFRYSFFVQYMKEAYDFIHYRYSHFPCLVLAYQNHIPIYVSKKRIVTAVVGGQSYGYYIILRGFIVASLFLKENRAKRTMFKSLYESNISIVRWYLSLSFQYKDEYEIDTIKRVIFNTMNWVEKAATIILAYPSKVYFLYKGLINKQTKTY